MTGSISTETDRSSACDSGRGVLGGISLRQGIFDFAKCTDCGGIPGVLAFSPDAGREFFALKQGIIGYASGNLPHGSREFGGTHL
jgi:hypothetical protein